MDFSPEELLEVIDRLVTGLIEQRGSNDRRWMRPLIAEEHLGIPVEVLEPAEEDERGRRRPRHDRRAQGSFCRSDMTLEQRHKAAAEGIARALLPDILRKLDVPVGTENKQFAAHVRSLVVGRVLAPTKLLRGTAGVHI